MRIMSFVKCIFETDPLAEHVSKLPQAETMTACLTAAIDIDVFVEKGQVFARSHCLNTLCMLFRYFCK